MTAAACSCDNCSREFAAEPPEWSCPWCGWNNHPGDRYGEPPPERPEQDNVVRKF
jgi:hypothetical protein